MYPFSTPWKHQKTLRFVNVFRGWRKGVLGTNGLIGGAHLDQDNEINTRRESPGIPGAHLISLEVSKVKVERKSWDLS